MDIFTKHPNVKGAFEALCLTRRDEILTQMLKTDSNYDKLIKKRADSSMALKKSISGTNADILFEAYSDAVYAQEIYELDIIYKQALYDALDLLKNHGII